MYLLIIGFQNGDVDYVGPFPTRQRAFSYGEIAETDYLEERSVKIRWHIVELIAPYCVVESVNWRRRE